jgi:calcineurin-like phosphoesterase family protein
MDEFDRRKFLKVSGISIGIGALFQVAPGLASGSAGEEIRRALREKNGEAIRPFSFVQMSDTHVGFSGPPDPLGTKAFENAVATINRLPQPPDLILVTGDLTHDSDDRGEHAKRMRRFQEIAAGLNVKNVKCVPGEHDAGLDGGALFRDVFGETFYSFDHRGVHFIGLDNVSRAKPEVGPEQLAWLEKDLSRFPRSAPLVVFTHRPLFDLKPEWEWFTSDGDDVMNALAPYENVTVLYGHIHRQHTMHSGNAAHYAARSLIFAFPDPEAAVEKKPIAFDKDRPFENLGLRVVREEAGRPAVDDIELTAQKFAGTVGIQQFLKQGAGR